MRERQAAGEPVSKTLLSAGAVLNVGAVNLDTTTSAALTRLPDGTFRISEEVACVIDDPSGAGSVSRVYAKIYRTGSESVLMELLLFCRQLPGFSLSRQFSFLLFF